MRLSQHQWLRPNYAGVEEPGLPDEELEPEVPGETGDETDVEATVEIADAEQSNDYSGLKVAEIKEELDNRGIDYEGVTLKNDLIELLKVDDLEQ